MNEEQLFNNMQIEDKIADIRQQVNYIDANIKVLLNSLQSEEIIEQEQMINFLIPISERLDSVLNKFDIIRSEF